MSIELVRWLVIAVVVYTAVTLLRSAGTDLGRGCPAPGGEA